MVIKTRGLVIRDAIVGERDRIITVLTADLGKISISVANSKRKGSRISAGTQLYVYSEFVLFKGKNSYSLNECEILKSFFMLSSNLDLLTCAVRLSRYAEDAIVDPAISDQVLKLTLHAFKELEKISKLESAQVDTRIVSSVFLLKLLQITGYSPHVNGCVRCGITSIDTIHFSFTHNGFLCETCSEQEHSAWVISMGVAKAILFTMLAPIQDVFGFELEEYPRDVFERFVESYASIHLQRSYVKADWTG